MEDIVNKNKIFAKYLNWKYVPHQEVEGKRFAGWRMENSDIQFGEFYLIEKLTKMGKYRGLWFTHICRNNNELIFHESWDWIMLVWKKYISHKNNVDIKYYDYLINCDLEGLYEELFKSISNEKS